MFPEVALTLCEMNTHLFGKCFIFCVKHSLWIQLFWCNKCVFKL